MKRHLIIDGLNIFIRNFTVNPTMDVNGEHAGGLIGFLMTLNMLIRMNSPTHVTIVWDGEGGSVKRRSFYKDYKAGRKPRFNREYDYEDPSHQVESFNKQLFVLDNYLKLLPVKSIRIKGTEGDDVIAFLCNFVIPHDDQKLIVSNDRDFYQLLNDKTVIWSPSKKAYITANDLKNDMKILPENFIYAKALVGDNSDSIRGVKGIGMKSVVKLFPMVSEREIDLNEMFSYAEENKETNDKYLHIIENRELIIGNVRLMQLSNPLMIPLATKSIRDSYDGCVITFKPLKIKMNLVRDGLRITSHDFFDNFKKQYNRSKNDGSGCSDE